MECRTRHYALVAVEGLDGSGKTTLVRGLAAALAASRSVHIARPARHSIQIFRELTGDDGTGPLLYQEHTPPDFRHAAYILETAVQFRYLNDCYSAHDLVIFDRWRQTWAVYCGEPTEYAGWLERLGSMIPVPDVLFYVRADPRTAAARLTARGDRWARVYPPPVLAAKLTALHERYEAELADGGAVVLDGLGSPEDVLRDALRTVAGLWDGQARRGPSRPSGPSAPSAPDRSADA